MKLLKFIVVLTFFAVFKTSEGLDFDQGLDLYRDLQTLNNKKFNITLNSTCLEDIELIFSTLTNKTLDQIWAITMIDSSAKIPNGLLRGSLIHIGQFDECLGVVHPDGHFKGQHCMADIVFNASVGFKAAVRSLRTPLNTQHWQRRASIDPLTLSYGICLPSTCSPQDMNAIFQSINLGNVIFDEINCWTDEPVEFSTGSWVVISLLIVLVVFVICSTLIELYHIHILRNDKPKGVLVAFSLYSNTIGLFEIRDSSGEMACLHGMRSLSMLWVVLGHTFEGFPNLPTQNLVDAAVIKTDISYILILNGLYSVDTFFFMSGLLVAFVFFRNISKTGSYDAPVSYIHRYIRLTPSLLLIVLMNMYVLADSTRGPLWGSRLAPLAEDCKNSWWSTLLYVQNYAQPDTSCLGQGWYLSCDMQMFWIAPIVLYPIYLWPKIGMAFLAFLTLGFTGLTLGLAAENGFKASVEVAVSGDQFYYDYITTHTRMMPWLVGVALGVAICVIKAHKTTIRLSKMTVIIGWIFSTGVCLGILYGFTRFQGDVDPSAAESVIYLSFSRLGWGIGLAWIVFACVYGYGGWANQFLSWGVFQPLGKLSYNVYLIHITIVAYRCAVYRTNFYFDNLNIIFEYSGVIILSYLFSTVIYLLVDAPFAILDRQLLSKIKILPYPAPKPKEPETRTNKQNIEVGVENSHQDNKD